MLPTLLLMAGLASSQAPATGLPDPLPIPLPTEAPGRAKIGPASPVSQAFTPTPAPSRGTATIPGTARVPGTAKVPGNGRLVALQPTPSEPSAEPLNIPVTIPEDVKTAKEEPAAESPPNRWAFMRAVQGTWMGVLLDDHKFNVYGWTQMSYNASTASGSNLPLAMDDRANEFLVNQNFLHFERTIDTSKREYQLGFATEWILPGSDYRFTLPRGLWNSQLTSNNGTPELYGVDAFQAYVQAFLPNSFKRGFRTFRPSRTRCPRRRLSEPDRGQGRKVAGAPCRRPRNSPGGVTTG